MRGLRRAAVGAVAISLLSLYLSAQNSPVTRGPYLQLGTPTSVVVRWRTSRATDSRVRYGTSPSNLSGVVDDAGPTTEHQVTLAGLAPSTRYYYSVGTTSRTLAGGDASYSFMTAPPADTSRPIRIWVIGDSGSANAGAAAVRDAYLTFTGARYTDLWLMLGDNAYNDGTDAEYQAAVFNMYPALLRQSVLWPGLGSHETHTSDVATQTGPYFRIFTLPAQGEAGGVASGTEAYYSFDYGNIHFVSLESSVMDRSPTGPMMTWLQNDLAATGKQWIIAFWHHPPYSKGSHNSDTEAQLIEMRRNALPILEATGVDLVLAGHSHSYERSFLMDRHYGLSRTLTARMKKDSGSGREDGTGAYKKPSLGLGPHEGTVYAVAGSSATTTGGMLNHPAMFLSLNVLGSMVVDVDGNRLDARFLDDTGVTRDYFTILKGVSAPAAPSSVTATAVSNSQINLTWRDNSTNEEGFKIERSSDGAIFSQIATVGPSVTNYSNAGLSASTTYYYRARAFNANGDSAHSNMAGATTRPHPPGAPSSLAATPASSSQINLVWKDSSTSEDGFKIERSTDGINFEQIATVGANVTSYVSAGLAPATTYYYRVCAFNAGGASTYSNTASATTASGDQTSGDATLSSPSTARPLQIPRRSRRGVE